MKKLFLLSILSILLFSCGNMAKPEKTFDKCSLVGNNAVTQIEFLQGEISQTVTKMESDIKPNIRIDNIDKSIATAEEHIKTLEAEQFSSDEDKDIQKATLSLAKSVNDLYKNDYKPLAEKINKNIEVDEFNKTVDAINAKMMTMVKTGEDYDAKLKAYAKKHNIKVREF